MSDVPLKKRYLKVLKDSDAKRRLSLSSLVLSEQIPLKVSYLKKDDIRKFIKKNYHAIAKNNKLL